MNTATLAQPESQLGPEIEALLGSGISYSRVVFVSAFAALRTVLRLRERLLAAAETGTALRLTLGIDLGGTSREVLEELVAWECEVFVYHNPIVRATFHPKIYLFESRESAVLFIGSNNLTDGGLYTNYEAATRYSFEFPPDADAFVRILAPLQSFIEPTGPTVRRLDSELIETLSRRGILPTETDARRSRRARRVSAQEGGAAIPPDPFSPVNVPMAPLLPKRLRRGTPRISAREEGAREEEISPPSEQPRPEGVLVWRKKLTRTDALQVRPGSHPVGGVRLTQAKFENPPGERIDQTTYFLRLFNDYDWEPEPGGHPDQELTFVPMRVFIRGVDCGVRNFEISHKPSGEAGQANYTTILRWGQNFNSTIRQAELTGAVLSLYETADANVGFLIDISDT